MISFNTCDPVEIFSNHTGSHNLLQKKKHTHLFQSIPVIYLDASSWSSLEVKKDLLLAAWPRSRALLIRDVHICAQMSTCNSWFSLWPGIQWFCVYVPVVIFFFFFFLHCFWNVKKKKSGCCWLPRTNKYIKYILSWCPTFVPVSVSLLTG